MSKFFEQLRRWLAVTGLTIGASSFYAVIPAAFIRYFFDLDPETYGERLTLFVWLPFFIFLIIFFYPRARKLLRAPDTQEGEKNTRKKERGQV